MSFKQGGCNLTRLDGKIYIEREYVPQQPRMRELILYTGENQNTKSGEQKILMENFATQDALARSGAPQADRPEAQARAKPQGT